MWQPEVQIAGGPWSAEVPARYEIPNVRQGRPFAISYDYKARKLEPFPIVYVDDKHAGTGPRHISHGVWDLDFFPPNDIGIEVNDDGKSQGGKYRLRFRKISEPGKLSL